MVIFKGTQKILVVTNHPCIIDIRGINRIDKWFSNSSIYLHTILNF